MAVELSAALISQLQSECSAVATAEALFPAADPVVKHRVEQAWQQVFGSAPESSDDLARSTLELVGRELLWNAAYSEPTEQFGEAEWQAYEYRLLSALEVTLTLLEVASHDFSSVKAVSLDAGAVFLPLFEEMIDLTSSQSWIILFAFLESRRKRLTENMQPNKGKALTLLRTLNTLLKLLCRSATDNGDINTTQVKLRARIHIFMASVYGITDPSGTNSRGDFAPLPRAFEHVPEASEDVEMKDETEAATGALIDPDDAECFRAIATLQRYFSQPTLIVKNNTSVSIADLKANADLVLRRLFHETTQPSSISESHLAGADWDRVDLATVELLPFQLSDPAFRRQLLAQFLLFLQILTQLNPDEKAKHPRLMLFPPTFSLAPEDVQWARVKFAEIREDFVKMGADGKQFDRFLRRVVTHDRHHAIWKSIGAYSFELEPQDVNWIDAAEQSAQLNLKANIKPYQWSSGTPALTQMDRDPLKSVEQLQKHGMNLTLETLKREYDEQDSEEEVEKREQAAAENKGDALAPLTPYLENKASLSWRALRLVVLSNLAAFEQTPKGDLPTLYSVITGTKSAKTEQADVPTEPKEAPAEAVEAVEMAEAETNGDAMDVNVESELPIETEVGIQVNGHDEVVEQPTSKR